MVSVVRYSIILVLLFPFVSLSAQQVVVVDKDTKEPLPYANIAFLKLNKGLYTGIDGNFTFSEQHSATDSVCIHMLGYQNIYTTIAALHDTIFMQPKTYTLPEAIIRPLNKTVRLGDIKKYGKSKFIITKDDYFMPHIIATIIRNEKQAGCYIKELQWRYHHHTDIHYVVRMQLYAVGSDGKPGEPLLQRSEPVTVEGKGLLTMDVTEEHFIFPAEGVFVGLEILEEINPYGKPMKDIRKLPYAAFLVHIPQTYFSYMEYVPWYVKEFSNNDSEKVPFGLMLRCPK